jgi:hypothetical protein
MFRPKYLIAVVGASFVGVLSMSSQALANWMVNGANLTGTAALATSATVDDEFEFTGGQVKVNCSGNTLRIEKPIINASTEMSEANSWEVGGCVGNEICPLAASMEGKIRTTPILIDLTLNGILAVEGRFLATNSSKFFTTIAFEGKECSLKGTQAIKGSQAFLMPTGRDERTLQAITMVREGEGITIGATAVTMTGSALGRLASGLPFSFL